LWKYLQTQQSPTSSPTPPLTKMSVSDKKKLFESAMEEHLKPSPKPGENIYVCFVYMYTIYFKYYIYFMLIYKISISKNKSIILYITDKIFSFLSQDEVEKMRQEEGKLLFVNKADQFFYLCYYIFYLNIIENNYKNHVFIEKKIATLTRDELKSWAQLDENEGLEDFDTMDDQDNGRPK